MSLTGEESSLLLFFLRKSSGDRDHIRVGTPGLNLVIRSSAKSSVSQGRSYSLNLINMTGRYCLCCRLMITREWANPNALALFPFCCCDKTSWQKENYETKSLFGLTVPENGVQNYGGIWSQTGKAWQWEQEVFQTYFVLTQGARTSNEPDNKS